MDKLRLAALALAILGLGGAVYAVAVPFPKYKDANREWMEAGRYNNAGPPMYGDPYWESQMEQARQREQDASDRRTKYRKESQLGVLVGGGLAATGFPLALIGLRGEGKGKAIAAIVVSLVVAGLLAIPLAAGVF